MSLVLWFFGSVPWNENGFFFFFTKFFWRLHFYNLIHSANIPFHYPVAAKKSCKIFHLILKLPLNIFYNYNKAKFLLKLSRNCVSFDLLLVIFFETGWLNCMFKGRLCVVSILEKWQVYRGDAYPWEERKKESGRKCMCCEKGIPISNSHILCPDTFCEMEIGFVWVF